ncbi:MAG TPA: hypothetical protein VHQ86_02735 [Candidatus Saccharimonadia bacterium]|nr:hypothetical protein [Candidatus Saccharimonadia bacterium]
MSSNNLIIVVLLITLLVVGVAVFAGKSLVTTIARNTTVVSKKSAADKQLQSDVTAAPKLVDAYNGLGDKSRTIADALPNTADFPSIIVTLENMTNLSGLTLKSVTPGLVQSADDESADTAGSAGQTASINIIPSPKTYKFQLEVTGNYEGLKKFLKEIETSARPMRVNGIHLAGGGSSLSGQLDVETYYQDKAILPFGKETVK